MSRSTGLAGTPGTSGSPATARSCCVRSPAPTPSRCRHHTNSTRTVRRWNRPWNDSSRPSTGSPAIPGVRLHSLAWRSSYRVKVRMVDQLRVGRVFLAGDAAHVHPIAGGLGMNSGIQDAYNLGWKLGLVLAGHATSGLLDTYEEERLPIASWLLDITSERLDAVLDAIKETGGGVDAVASPELTQLMLRIPVEPALPPHRKPVHRAPAGRPGTGRAAARRRHRLAHPPLRSLPRAALHPARSWRTLRRGVRRRRNGHR